MDVVVAWAVFSDGTGAADIAEDNEGAVQRAIKGLAKENQKKVRASGFMSLRTYEGLRAKAKRRGIGDGPSALDLLR